MTIPGPSLAPPARPPQPRDLALEGLRGAAALAVLIAHLTIPLARPAGGGVTDPAYPGPLFLWNLQYGGLAVLLFFLLSGHVIGLSVNRPFSPAAAGAFLVRRAIRLLPIYWIGLALAWIAAPELSPQAIVGHLLFMQNSTEEAIVPVLHTNPNLWSLPYEVFYYLAFPLVWLARPLLIIPLSLAILAAASLAYGVGPEFPLAVLAASVFWTAGLASAWNLPRCEPDEKKSPWPTVLLIALATWRLDPIGALLSRLHLIESFSHASFQPKHFAALPILFWMLVIIARRRPPFPRLLEAVCWAIPVMFLVWRALRGTLTDNLLFPGVLLFIAVVLRGWRPGLGFWRTLAPIGAVSYALYVIAYPVQIMTRKALPDFSGSFFTWSVRVSFVAILSLALAWWLELRLQPRIVALLKSRRGSRDI